MDYLDQLDNEVNTKTIKNMETTLIEAGTGVTRLEYDHLGGYVYVTIGCKIIKVNVKYDSPVGIYRDVNKAIDQYIA